MNHEYLSIDGIRSFTDASAKLILGADSPAIASKRVTHLSIKSIIHILTPPFFFKIEHSTLACKLFLELVP